MRGEPAQPFYAAYLRSRGLPPTLAAAAKVKEQEGSHYGFLAFMGRARSSFPARHMTASGSIADHAAWARHVEQVARDEGDALVPACAHCGRFDCQHPDPVFAGITPHSEVQ